MTAAIALIILAIVLFLLAAFNTPSSRVSLGWLGAAALAGAMLLGHGV